MTLSDIKRRPIAAGALMSAGIRIVNILLGFVLVVLLARVLGAEGYGIYAFALSFASILSILPALGLPKLVVRETSRGEALENWSVVSGIWRWSGVVAAILSLSSVLLAGVVLWLFAARLPQDYYNTIAASLILIPFVVLGNLRGAALRGLRHVALGQLPENVLRPGLLIILVVVVVVCVTGERLEPATAMLLHIFAGFLAFVVGAVLLRRAMPSELVAKPPPFYESRAWLYAIMPLALTSVMQNLNRYADILILGFLRPAEDVGVYRVAVQGGTLVVFALSTIGAVLAPYFVRNYARADMAGLQRLVTMSSRAAFAFALGVAAVLFHFGQPILAAVFGVEFEAAYAALSIITVGQLISAFFGATPLLLNMTGNERETARTAAVAAMTNIALNIVLIPSLGIRGAACASAIALVMWNVMLWRIVHERLGIDSMAVRWPKKV